MIVIWHRSGLLVGAYYALGLWLGSVLAPIYAWPAAWFGEDAWGLLLGLTLGAYLTWRIGTIMNEDEEDKHRLYFVPVEVWGLVGLIGCAVGFGAVAVSRYAKASGRPAPAAAHVAAAGPAAPAPMPLNAVARVPAYRVTAVARTGPDVGRWLFELTDPQGARHMLQLGDRLDAWTLTAFTNECLVLTQSGGGGRFPLPVPRKP